MIKKGASIISGLDHHTLEVVRKSGISLFLKAIGILISLLVSVFLGQLLGAKGFGVINLVNRISIIVVTFCLLGFYQLNVKEIAIAYQNKNWLRIGSWMKSSFILNGITSLLVSVFLILLAPYISINVFKEPELTIPLIIGLAAIIPQVFSRVFSSGLIGFRKIWQGNLVDEVLSSFVLGVLLLALYITNYEFTLSRVAICYAISKCITTISIGAYWKILNKSSKKKPRLILKKLLKASPHFFLISMMAIIGTNIDGILVGVFLDTKNVGLYAVAARIALFTSFFLQVSNTAISPKIAAMYRNGEIKALNKMIQKITLGLLIIGFLFMLTFIIFGKFFLSLWGADFIEAYTILVILSIGQFFNIGTGAAGFVLIMCGYEKIQSIISIFSVLFNIILNLIMIQLFGVIGAAIATAFTVFLENIIKLIYAKRKTNILTLPLNILINDS